MEETGLVRPELVFGLVGAVGSDLELVERALRDSLRTVGYETHLVRLSELVKPFAEGLALPDEPEEERLAAYMTAGDNLREKTKRGDALAVLAMGNIRKLRRDRHGEPSRPLSRCAYILRSLKHDAEVDRLRLTYGPGFLLVGAYAPYQMRCDRLARTIARSHHSEDAETFRAKAEDLIQRDQFEPSNEHGQRVRETFHKADVFIDLRNEQCARDAIKRFIELLFRHPNHTPSRHEYAMFHACATALRSGSLARQVGAAIATRDGEIIALGTNDVPRPGGGLYWSDDGSLDKRDFQLGYDCNAKMKIDAVREVLSALGKEGWFNWELGPRGEPAAERLTEACSILKDTRIMNLTEFGREVHAEMAALLDAAKRGVSVRDAMLYCTTFPCHNCAKHIVAAGIREVHYIEPYPKSVAPELYEDSIAVDEEPANGRIPFKPFVGVGSRRYMDLFAMVNSEGWVVERKDEFGKIVLWDQDNAYPRLPMWDRSYLEREALVIESFEKAVGE